MLFYRFLEDTPLTETEQIRMEFEPKTNMYHLTLKDNLRGMSGTVRVLATNKGGKDETKVNLKITGRAPTFIEKPLKCTVLEGDMAVFCCRIDGDPIPKVSWSKGKWRKMENTTTTRVFYKEPNDQYTLEIDNIKKKDAGTYTVTLNNEFGEESTSVTLIVTDKPEEAEDWKSSLKHTEIKEKVETEEEYDWRNKLKKAKGNVDDVEAEELTFQLKKVEQNEPEKETKEVKMEVEETQMKSTTMKFEKREPIELSKRKDQEKEKKEPIKEEPVEKSKYERQKKEPSEPQVEEKGLKIGKVQVIIDFNLFFKLFLCLNFFQHILV